MKVSLQVIWSAAPSFKTVESIYHSNDVIMMSANCEDLPRGKGLGKNVFSLFYCILYIFGNGYFSDKDVT